MLVVSDLAISVAFYHDLLGGAVAYRFPDDDPVFVTVRLGTSEIGIGSLPAEPVHGQAQRPASGHRIELCLYVSDVGEVVTLARSRNVPVLLDPCDQPWGERIAYIADPDGNLLMLTQRPR